jgi:UTP:GlnB (protein PII) uridylyltransferase
VAHPERILLFGSAARGEMGPHSDIDLLVIKRGKFHRGRLVETIYRHLYGAGAAVDVIIATPEEVERYRNAAGLVIAPALNEGIAVYGAETMASRRSPRMAQPRAKQPRALPEGAARHLSGRSLL